MFGLPETVLNEVAKQIPIAFVYLILGLAFIELVKKIVEKQTSQMDRIVENQVQQLERIHERIDDGNAYAPQILSIVTQTNQLMLNYVLRETQSHEIKIVADEPNEEPQTHA